MCPGYSEMLRLSRSAHSAQKWILHCQEYHQTTALGFGTFIILTTCYGSYILTSKRNMIIYPKIIPREVWFRVQVKGVPVHWISHWLMVTKTIKVFVISCAKKKNFGRTLNCDYFSVLYRHSTGMIPSKKNCTETRVFFWLTSTKKRWFYYVIVLFKLVCGW